MTKALIIPGTPGDRKSHLRAPVLRETARARPQATEEGRRATLETIIMFKVASAQDIAEDEARLRAVGDGHEARCARAAEPAVAAALRRSELVALDVDDVAVLLETLREHQRDRRPCTASADVVRHLLGLIPAFEPFVTLVGILTIGVLYTGHPAPVGI